MSSKNIVINLTEGIYYYDSNKQLYFVERKYVPKSLESIQLFVSLVLIVIVSYISNYIITPYIEYTIKNRIILSLSYTVLFIIAFKILSVFTEKKYNTDYKTSVSDKEKHKLVIIIKRIVVVFSLFFLIIFILAIWIQYRFIAGKDSKMLIDSSVVVAGVIVYFGTMEIDIVKFYRCLLKDVIID